MDSKLFSLISLYIKHLFTRYLFWFILLLFKFHFKGEVLLQVEAAHRNKTCISTAGTFFFVFVYAHFSI